MYPKIDGGTLMIRPGVVASSEGRPKKKKTDRRRSVRIKRLEESS
jgi:hypothetical protein